MSILRGEKVHQKIWEQRKQRSPGRSAGAPGLNCLVLGGGGREYAICWRLANCSSVSTIDVMPGNAGLSLFTRGIDRRGGGAALVPHPVVPSPTHLPVLGD